MNINTKTAGVIVITFAIVMVLVISLIKGGYDRQAAFLCDAVSKNPDFDMTQCPVHKNNNTSWYIAIAFGVAFLILGVGVYLFFMATPLEKKESFAEVDLSKMDEDEKLVYTKIKEKGGSMYQGDLVRETEFTKVKVTRILDKLELSGIVEKKRRGMTNIVVLR